MATGAQAIARIAEATGILPATVSRAARALREADPLLWPEAGKGGGKRAVHVEPHHLINLVLALAVADPITSAPEKVRLFSTMTAQEVSKLRHSDAEDGASSTITVEWRKTFPDPGTKEGTDDNDLLSDNLGDELSQWVFMLGRRRLNEQVRVLLRRKFMLNLSPSPISIPSATLRTPRSGYDLNQVYYPDREHAVALILTAPEELPAAPKHIVRVPFELIEVLGELWADTLTHHPAVPPDSLPPPAVPNAEQENESAGSFPKKPTLSGYQPHDDDRTDTGNTRKDQASRNPDPIVRVCLPSRGVEPEAGLTTGNLRRRIHDPASHHHALL